MSLLIVVAVYAVMVVLTARLIFWTMAREFEMDGDSETALFFALFWPMTAVFFGGIAVLQLLRAASLWRWLAHRINP